MTRPLPTRKPVAYALGSIPLTNARARWMVLRFFFENFNPRDTLLRSCCLITFGEVRCGAPSSGRIQRQHATVIKAQRRIVPFIGASSSGYGVKEIKRP